MSRDNAKASSNIFNPQVAFSQYERLIGRVVDLLICDTAQLESGFLIWWSIFWRCWTEDSPEEEVKVIFAQGGKSVSYYRHSPAKEQWGQFFSKTRQIVAMHATAPPWHSHHNQFGGSFHARNTAVCSYDARTKVERKYICNLNTL